MINIYKQTQKTILIFLIFLYSFVFSNSMALISAGGAYGDGGSDYYINYIIVASFFYYMFFQFYFRNGLINIGYIRSPFFYYILMFFVLTIIQLLVGVNYRGVMFTDLFLMLLMFLVVWYSYNQNGDFFIYNAINKFYLVFFILSLFLIFFVPNWGLSRNSTVWQGMFNQKNVLGLFCVSYYLFLIIFKSYKLKIIVYINMILALVLCFGSNSYTSLFCCILSLIVVFIGFKFNYFLNKISFFLLLISFIFPFLIVYLSVGQLQLNILDKDFSFTGRDSIWIYSIKNIAESPFLGSGYSAIAYQNGLDNTKFKYDVGFVVNSNHNGYIGILYNYGLVGLIFYFILILTYYYKARSISYHGVYAGFILIFTILNTFEDRLFSVNILFYIFAIMLCYIDYTYKFKFK